MEALNLDLAALAARARVEPIWLKEVLDPAAAAEIDLTGLERVDDAIRVDGRHSSAEP